MLKTRVIPTLLWKDHGLVKGKSFDSWRRVGTVLPAIKVYNTREVDELILVDITATIENRDFNYDEIEEFTSESFVPLTVGGGIKNIDQIRSTTNFDNVIRTSSFFNSNFADESATVFGRVERTFKKIRARLGARFSYAKQNQFVQGIRTVNENFTQSYSPELRTNFREAPNVRLRYTYSIANNDQGVTSTKFVTNAPSLEFDAYLWKSLTLRTDFTYTNQDDGVRPSQSFQTWDASLAYRKDKDAKWEYEVKATNLLDIDSNVNNSANNISVFNSETFIQPRFVTFRVIYSL